MKKYLTTLVLFGLVFTLSPSISEAQVSSVTVERRVVPRDVPILKKSYQSVPSATQTVPTVARSVLKMGMRGEDVRNLQALLFNHGFPMTAIDGAFGRETDTAVRAFQVKTGLKVDGMFGPGSATFLSMIPAGTSLSVLSDVEIQSLREEYVATVTRLAKTQTQTTPQPISTATVTATNKAVKTTVARLPKGLTVASLLTKSLPTRSVVSKVAIPISNPGVKSSIVTQAITKKPKLAPIFSAASKFTLVTAGNSNSEVATSSGITTNFSSGAAGTANSQYICIEYEGSNACTAVSNEVAALISSGYIDARDVAAEILSGASSSDCPECFLDREGNISVSAGSAGGGCAYKYIGRVCVELGDGVANYKVSYTRDIVVDTNGSNSNFNLLIDPLNAAAPNITASLVSYDTNNLYFTAPRQSDLLSDYVGYATLQMLNGASIFTINQTLQSLGHDEYGGYAKPDLGLFTKSCSGQDATDLPPEVISGVANYRPGLLPGELPDSNRADFNITFNTSVTVIGSPLLNIVNTSGDPNAVATYMSGSGTTTIKFHTNDQKTTPPDPGHDWLVDYEGTGVIELNGGTIKSGTGVDAMLTLPAGVIFENPDN